MEYDSTPPNDKLATILCNTATSEPVNMHEINSLRQANVDSNARIAAVQNEAAKSGYQQRIHQLENQNFDLESEIKQLQSRHKHAVKQEATFQDEEDLRHLAQVIIEKDAVIQTLSDDAEDNKALICVLRAQPECQKDAETASKQSTYNANDKLEKLTKKYNGLKKRFDTQGRALKKLKTQGTQASSKGKTIADKLKQSLPIKKTASNSDKPSSNGNSHTARGGYANPMHVDEDEDMDDEEEIPLSLMKKMKTEPMDIDDLPLKQRVSIKKEKLASRPVGMDAKAESVSVVVNTDSNE